MAKSAAPKLKVFATIWYGLSYAFRHIPLMLRAGWPIFLANWIVYALPVYMLDFPSSKWSYYFNTVYFFTFMKLPLAAHFAVAWHRSILLGDSNPITLRFGKPEFLYAAVGLLLALPNMAFHWIKSHTPIFETAQLLAEFPDFLIPAIVFLAAPILPALAIGDHAMSLRTIFSQIRGNWIRLICLDVILIAMAIPIYWVTGVVFLFFYETLRTALSIGYSEFDEIGIGVFKAALAAFLSTSVWAFATLFVVATGLSVLSITYAGIVRRTLASKIDYAAVDRLAARLSD